MVNQSKIYTMIMLVSDQTIPNLVGVKKLQPCQVVLLDTQEPRIKQAGNNLAAYIKKLFPQTLISIETVESNEPESTRLVCKNILQQQNALNTILNITGGTKLMAVGALLAAQEMEAPVFYVDSFGRGFVNLLGNVFSESELPHLTVDDFFGVVGGRILKESTMEAEENSENWFRLVYNVMGQFKDWEQTQQYLSVVAQKGELTFTRADMVRIKDKRYQCNWLIMQSYLKAGLFRRIVFNSGTVSGEYTGQKEKDMVLKKGLMLELLVFYRLKEIFSAADIRIGVNYEWKKEDKYEIGVNNEIDVFMAYGGRLSCFSCKSGIPQTKDLNELDALAGRIGGTFVRKFLVCAPVPPVGLFAERAKKMGINLLGISDFLGPVERLLCKMEETGGRK